MRRILLNTTGVQSNQLTIVSAVEGDIEEVASLVCWSCASPGGMARCGPDRGCGLYLSILEISGSLSTISSKVSLLPLKQGIDTHSILTSSRHNRLHIGSTHAYAP